MSGLCIVAGKLFVAIPVSAFTLATIDPVDRSRQEVDWKIQGNRLVSSAPPTAGRLDGMTMSLQIGKTPAAKPQNLPQITLTHAPEAPQYELCLDARCRPLPSLLTGIEPIAVIEIKPCPDER